MTTEKIQANGKNGNGKNGKFLEDIYIQNLGTVYGLRSKLSSAMAQLATKNAFIISGRDFAYSRRVSYYGEDRSLSNLGSIISEAVINIPDYGRILTKDSPILSDEKIAKEATKAHENDTEAYIFKELAESYITKANAEKEKNPAESRTLILENLVAIPINKMPFDKRTLFLFEDEVEETRKFLDSLKVKEICFHFDSIDNINKHEGGPYINQLLMGCIERDTLRIMGTPTYNYLGSKDCVIRGLAKLS